MQKKKNSLNAKSSKTHNERKPEQLYSIKDMCKLFSISRTTVYKWLSINDPEDAVIPRSGWLRLPSGHIRIYEWIVIKLQKRQL